MNVGTTYYTGKRILVTGGASFIGSHLTEALVAAGAVVRVADDLSSGKLENLSAVADKIEFLRGDLRGEDVARRAINDMDIVFHLAAAHGGRGYVDTHQAVCATNFLLDSQVFNQALVNSRSLIQKVVFASSACIYPTARLDNPDETLYLTEDMAGPPYEPDNVYGLAKLSAEIQLRAYARDFGLKSAVCRFFHVYGPRMVENHALAAFMARAYTKQDPFVVWGDGRQVRDWIHVSDIVSGLLLAGERIDDGTPVNLGTGERRDVLDAVSLILYLADHTPDIRHELDKPTGPQNRVADTMWARDLLEWHSRIIFPMGIAQTWDWYVASHDERAAVTALETKLMER